MATSATAEPVSRTASIAGRIDSRLLSASKMRKMSMPVAVASATNADVTTSGYGVYPTLLRPRNSLCRKMFGIPAPRFRLCANGVAPRQGHRQEDGRHRGQQRGQPLPRVLLQKAQRHIVS